MTKIILASISLLLLSSVSLFSENKVISINVNPLNRIRISFEKLPNNYISELSDDKKLISIKINEPFQFIDTTLTFQGIIKKAIIKSNNEFCDIFIELNDRRGYTIASLPYSNTLMLDVFDWSSLSKGEDKLRSALIALESKVKESSYSDLIESIKENTKEASSILGLELIKENYIESAKLLLKYSINQKDTSIYEVYAGISDIFNSENNLSKSNEYSSIFLNISQNKKLDFLLSSYRNPNDSLFLKKLNFLDSILKISLISDSTSITTSDSNKIVSNDSSKTNVNFFDSAIIEYAVYFLLALLLLIIYFYAKWRNQKIQDIIETKKIKIPKKESIEPELNVEKKPTSNKLANFYKKQEIATENNEIQKNVKTEYDKVKEQNEKSRALLDIVKKVQDENKSKEKEEKELPISETKSKQQLPAKVEIALNIANEQKRIKDQSLEEFNSLSLPADTEKLHEISKKLGIEMGGFEIRKQMERIMKNDKDMEELKNKFTNRTE